MNYYNEIKNELINNEIYKKAKDYSKNKHDLSTYYNVGKLLSEAGKHYGDSIIKEYAKKLMIDVNKKYNVRYLYDMKRLYKFSKLHPLGAQLTFSHYRVLFSLNDKNEILYYINEVINKNLSKRQLQNIIKNKEYERLPEKTKDKLINNEKTLVQDFIKNPIIIKNRYNYENVSERLLKQLILEDIPSFMKELGNGFSFIGSEYKIKLGNRYNYIDLLLFNINYNCYVVIELKITELKKEHIGQIETYMNFIDKNIKTIYHDKTVGIIICKKNNEFVIEYASDDRILSKEYILS